MSGNISRRDAYDQLRLNLQAAERALKSNGGEPNANTINQLTNTKQNINDCINKLQNEMKNEKSNLWIKFWENRKIKQAEKMATKLQKVIDANLPRVHQTEHLKKVIEYFASYRTSKKRELKLEMNTIKKPNKEINILKGELNKYIHSIKLPEPVRPGAYKPLSLNEMEKIIDNQKKIEDLFVELKTAIANENAAPVLMQPGKPVEVPNEAQAQVQEAQIRFNPRQALNAIKERLFDARKEVFQATYENRKGPGIKIYLELTIKLEELENRLTDPQKPVTQEELASFKEELEKEISGKGVLNILREGERELTEAVDLLEKFGTNDSQKPKPSKILAEYRQLFAQIPALSQSLVNTKKECTLNQVTKFKDSVNEFYMKIKSVIMEEAFLEASLKDNLNNLEIQEEKQIELQQKISQKNVELEKTNIELNKINNEVELLTLELKIFESIKTGAPEKDQLALDLYIKKDDPNMERLSKKISDLMDTFRTDKKEFEDEFNEFKTKMREKVELQDALKLKQASLQEAARILKEEEEKIKPELERLKNLVK